MRKQCTVLHKRAHAIPVLKRLTSPQCSVLTKVSPKQFQIFDYYVLREWDAAKVRRQLGVTIAQVYLAKHRVGSALKKELQFLQSQEKEK